MSPSLKAEYKLTFFLFLNIFLQEKQQRDLEQTRNDMMTVIQAIRSENYRLDSEDGGGSQKPKELQNELTKMRADYEARIAELQQKHEEVLREVKKFRSAVPHATLEEEAEVCHLIEVVSTF